MENLFELPWTLYIYFGEGHFGVKIQFTEGISNCHNKGKRVYLISGFMILITQLCGNKN